MTNTDYALKKEETDYLLLKDFNSFLGLKSLDKCPEKHTTDASGYTQDGKYINIELKQRDISINTYSSLYIEAHKVGDMLLDYVLENKIPLYVNFLKDGYVVVFNLSKLKHRPNKVAKRIWSELYQGFELAKREELKLEDAYIYRKENNKYKLIHKP